MSFFKKLFGGDKKRPSETVRGVETAQTNEQQISARSRMEAEMTASRSAREGNASISGDSVEDARSEPDKEEVLLALVTQACAGRDLQIARVDVQRLEGGTVPTLRFT